MSKISTHQMIKWRAVEVEDGWLLVLVLGAGRVEPQRMAGWSWVQICCGVGGQRWRRSAVPPRPAAGFASAAEERRAGDVGG